MSTRRNPNRSDLQLRGLLEGWFRWLIGRRDWKVEKFGGAAGLVCHRSTSPRFARPSCQEGELALADAQAWDTSRCYIAVQ